MEVGETDTDDAIYQAHYTFAYERGLAFIDALIRTGRLRVPSGESEQAFKAGRADAFACACVRNLLRPVEKMLT